MCNRSLHLRVYRFIFITIHEDTFVFEYTMKYKICEYNPNRYAAGNRKILTTMSRAIQIVNLHVLNCSNYI